MIRNHAAIRGAYAAPRCFWKERIEHLRSAAAHVTALAITLFACGALAPAQQPPERAIVRDLNNQILALGEESASVPTTVRSVRSRRSAPTPDNSPQVSQQAAELISRRAAALEKLIAADPGGALSLAFSQTVLDRLASKYPALASLLESHGSWQGPLEFLIFDGADGKTFRSLRRIKIGERWIEIHFAGREAGFKSSDILRVTGMRAGNTVAAVGGSVEGSLLAPHPSKLTAVSAGAAACATTGEHRTAVILATFPGVAPPFPAQNVRDIFFGTAGRSLDDYWREASYGSTRATGDVFGWYTLNQAYTCDTAGNLPAAAMVAANADVNFQDYTHLYFVAPFSGCWWSGLTMVSCAPVNTPDGTVTASSTSIVASHLGQRDAAVALIAHEAGHTLGLLHARSRSFGAEALGPVGAVGSPGEYGDSFSSMGAPNLGHYAAPHKAETLGWLTENANYQVVQSTGTYSLQPIELGPAGLQALKIERDAASGSWLWLEYRQPVGGYDTALPNQLFSGALIHYQDAETTSTGARTDLLDFTPQTSNALDPILAPGQRWDDPYTNLSLTVESATANQLTVNVSYGGGVEPCTHANPAVTISPSNPAVSPGGEVAYTLSVTNRDSPSCAASTFNLSSSQPANWSTSFSPGSVTTAPGETRTATMTKTVPPGTTAGTYPVTATATASSSTGSGQASCTVLSPSSKVSASTEGSGVLFSDDGLIYCPGDCDAFYSTGVQVRLSAVPDNKWRFDHWEGDCSGSTVPCVITAMGSRNVKAVFARGNAGGGGGGNGGGPKK